MLETQFIVSLYFLLKPSKTNSFELAHRQRGKFVNDYRRHKATQNNDASPKNRPYTNFWPRQNINSRKHFSIKYTPIYFTRTTQHFIITNNYI